MITDESIKEFEKWATERGLSIEKSGGKLPGGTIVYGYIDHGTGMAFEGWLGREDLFIEGSKGMTNEEIREIALANGFDLKAQRDGSMDLNPYVYEFAQALLGESPVQGSAPVQRWRPTTGDINKIKMEVSPTGKYVKYSDYLKANDELKAEVQRLQDSINITWQGQGEEHD